MNLADFVPSFLESSARGGLLILFFLLMRPALRRCCGSRWVSILWGVLLMRMLVPVPVLFPLEVELPFTLFRSDAGDVSEWTLTEDPTMPPLQAASTQSAQLDRAAGPAAKILQPWGWLGSVWLGGMGVCGLIQVLKWISLRKLSGNLRMPEDPRIMTVFRSLPPRIRKQVTVYISPDVEVPCMSGICRPEIWLPEREVQTYSDQDLKHIFLHELGHVQRRDVLNAACSACVSCLHWFNPLVWVGIKVSQADREMACDAWVLRHLNPSEQEGYGITLLKVIKRLSHPSPSGLIWIPALRMATPFCVYRKRFAELGLLRQRTVSPNRVGMGVGMFLSLLLFVNLPYRARTEPEPHVLDVEEPSPDDPNAKDGKNEVHVSAKFVEFPVEQFSKLEKTFPELVGGIMDQKGIGVATDPHIDAFLKRLSELPDSDILSAPRVVKILGQEAVLEVSQAFIYPTTWDWGISSEGKEELLPGNFETENLGVKLRITAYAPKPDAYKLDLEARVSAFEGFFHHATGEVAVGHQDQTHHPSEYTPMFRKRAVEIETELVAGQGMLIGPLQGNAAHPGEVKMREGEGSDILLVIIQISRPQEDPEE